MIWATAYLPTHSLKSPAFLLSATLCDEGKNVILIYIFFSFPKKWGQKSCQNVPVCDVCYCLLTHSLTQVSSLSGASYFGWWREEHKLSVHAAALPPAPPSRRAAVAPAGLSMSVAENLLDTEHTLNPSSHLGFLLSCLSVCLSVWCGKWSFGKLQL